MADTRFLRNEVELYVRNWLNAKFSTIFRSECLPLIHVRSAALHELDAVSTDRRIVCAIKTASWMTGSGKRGTGKIHGVIAEVYFLDHVEADQKFLVLTDLEFHERLVGSVVAKFPSTVDILHCQLPEHLWEEVR